MKLTSIYYSLCVKDKEDLLQIGKRYVISYGYGMSSEVALVLDFSNDVFSEVEGFLKEFLHGYSCIPKCSNAKKSIIGTIEDGYFSTKDWSENIAQEIGDVEHLKSILKPTFDKYLKCVQKENKLKSNFEFYTNVLLNFLKREGISAPTCVQQDIDNCILATRFLGGFDSWSGAEEDICDADKCSPKTSRLINKAVKDFNNKYEKLVKVEWQTGEKAYTYFDFIPEEDNL